MGVSGVSIDALHESSATFFMGISPMKMIYPNDTLDGSEIRRSPPGMVLNFPVNKWEKPTKSQLVKAGFLNHQGCNHI